MTKAELVRDLAQARSDALKWERIVRILAKRINEAYDALEVHPGRPVTSDYDLEDL